MRDSHPDTVMRTKHITCLRDDPIYQANVGVLQRWIKDLEKSDNKEPASVVSFIWRRCNCIMLKTRAAPTPIDCDHDWGYESWSDDYAIETQRKAHRSPSQIWYTLRYIPTSERSERSSVFSTVHAKAMTCQALGPGRQAPSLSSKQDVIARLSAVTKNGATHDLSSHLSLLALSVDLYWARNGYPGKAKG